MPFYKALEFLINTSGSKVKRKRWPEGFYLMKEYDTILSRNNIVMHFRMNDIRSDCKELYSARGEDMVATDWEIVQES